MASEKRLIYADDFLDLFYVASAGQDKAFIKAVEMVVADTPDADAAPVVHGRWEACREGFPYLCSNCHKSHDYEEHYCPNCGAKMDGERDGE